MSTILVADDVKLERLHVTEILKRNGHTVIEAINGIEATEKAKQFKPDIIIMDIVMPDRDGFTATKRIMMDPETRHIPVIVVSSKSRESDIERARMVGAKGYLVKPVKDFELMAEIKKYL